MKRTRLALSAVVTILLLCTACGTKASAGPEAALPQPGEAGASAAVSAEPPQNAPATAAPVTGAQEQQTPVEMQEAKLLRNLLVYSEQGGDSRELEAGTEVLVQEEGNGEWMLCMLDGETLWLHLNPDNPFMVEAPSGWLHLWVAMDGLDFAN